MLCWPVFFFMAKRSGKERRRGQCERSTRRRHGMMPTRMRSTAVHFGHFDPFSSLAKRATSEEEWDRGGVFEGLEGGVG